MSATVAAALKKIAVSLLSNPKVLKTIGGIILGIIIIILTPIVTLIALFNGDITVDTDRLHEMVIENMPSEEMNQLQHVQDTVNTITTAMTEAGYSGTRLTEAHMIYTMALSSHSHEEGFVDKLVGCFASDQTDDQLIAAVNTTFGTSISATEFTNMMAGVREKHIDISGYTDPTTKNNLDLVQWAIYAEESGWGYVWGTFGQVLDESLFNAKLEQYPEQVGRYSDFIESNWMARRTADCVGFIKGYCWLDPTNLQIVYATNGAPDISADQMYQNATEKGAIDTIPEISGLAVWHEGHIGIYIGNGLVIEAKGTRYGVVQTQLSSGSWTHWLKIPYITYVEPVVEPIDPTTPSTEPTTPIQGET